MRVTLCADDYAFSAPISSAILDLAQTGRISAVSCMTTSRLWPELGPALRPLADKIDIGLHLTLVDETPLTPMPRLTLGGRLPSIARLIAKSYFGQLPKDEISAEIDAQAAAFTKIMGRPPAHIDGHLHAHVLPGIREAVLAAAVGMMPRPWLRTLTGPGTFRRAATLKAKVLGLLGYSFTLLARRRGFLANDSISGFYDFARGDYASAFPEFLRDAGPRHLILCHPGHGGDTAAWSHARAAEYNFLRGGAFATLLKDIEIVRLRGSDETLAMP